jgi:Ca-activated chloride channel family protein
VIDRSGSMRGAAIENAKAAALSMLRQLDGRDSFTLVTYSSGAESVIPLQRATEDNKSAARAAIETIYVSGVTCLSCGLETGSYELTHAPSAGVRRILLISDGQANAGVYHRDQLAQLAAHKASGGVSISTVGVGLDFDENIMRRLAELGRGNYYFVEDTVALSAMFSRELGTITQTVASEVRLKLIPTDGVRIEEVYGYPMTRGSNGEVIVPVADMRGGESRKVVVRLTVATTREGTRTIARAEASWRRVSDSGVHHTSTIAQADVTNDPSAVTASVDQTTLQAVQEALSARALEEASAAYDREGTAGATRVLELRKQAIRREAPQLKPEAARALEKVSDDAAAGFSKAPEKAKKAASVKSYELAR